MTDISTPTDAELQTMCAEVIAWQETGDLPGTALRDYAARAWPGVKNALQMAERDVSAAAMKAVARWGTPTAGEPVACGACYGSGWVVRDPDIDTDQECFVCDGSGVSIDAPTPPAPQAPQPEALSVWPQSKDVGRIGDMSPSAFMRVGLDSDNDVYVSVWGEDGGGSVEFCNGGGGGGQSMRTRMALIALMVAIEADNAEKPSLDWWAKRNGGIKGASND